MAKKNVSKETVDLIKGAFFKEDGLFQAVDAEEFEQKKKRKYLAILPKQSNIGKSFGSYEFLFIGL